MRLPGRGVYISLHDTLCESYNKTGTTGRGLLLAVVVPKKLADKTPTMSLFNLGAGAGHNGLVVYDNHLVYTLGEVS